MASNNQEPLEDGEEEVEEYEEGVVGEGEEDEEEEGEGDEDEDEEDDTTDYMCRIGAIYQDSTIFMMCDSQERYRESIYHFSDIVRVIRRLTDISRILEIPLIVTEQHPPTLGHTLSELDIAHAIGVFEKTKFTMVVPEVESVLENIYDGRVYTLVIFGFETHVVVEQTAIDLLERGYNVHVVADATSSRNQFDRLLAFDRLRQIGCFVSTAESIVFKMLGDKTHPKFNDARWIVHQPPPITTPPYLMTKATTVQNFTGLYEVDSNSESMVIESDTGEDDSDLLVQSASVYGPSTSRDYYLDEIEENLSLQWLIEPIPSDVDFTLPNPTKLTQISKRGDFPSSGTFSSDETAGSSFVNTPSGGSKSGKQGTNKSNESSSDEPELNAVPSHLSVKTV